MWASAYQGIVFVLDGFAVDKGTVCVCVVRLDGALQHPSTDTVEMVNNVCTTSRLKVPYCPIVVQCTSV